MSITEDMDPTREGAEKSGNTIDYINPIDFERSIHKKSGIVLLDVRSREEYYVEHIAGTVNIPVDELEVRRVNELSQSHLMVIYASDRKSEIAFGILKKIGFNKVGISSGGMEAWRQVAIKLPTPINPGRT